MSCINVILTNVAAIVLKPKELTGTVAKLLYSP